MKTQISRDTFNSARHYSGVQLQQGRMIVDADWNELSDIARTRLDAALAGAIRSGAPRGSAGLRLNIAGGVVSILPGSLYVEGVPARLDALATGIAPTAQPDYPTAPPLPAGNLRFYADVWERSVSALEDPELMDPGLHGADTATRSRTMLQVKWCDPATDPSSPATNPPLGDAPLTLTLRTIAAAGDACDPCAAEVAVDERIGNYLFRVEVHAFTGTAGNRQLTLKWSRDNGAEAYPVGATPAGFGQGSWVWEFFDAASEMQLGNHLAAGFTPRRGILAETFTVPASAADPQAFVRQWDGFATLNVDGNALVAGVDRGVTLSAALADEAHGHVTIGAGSVTLNLELMELTLAYGGRAFVPGDYWLAAVREAVQASGDTVLAAAPPRGVRHHYLELGQRIGGVPVPPPVPAGWTPPAANWPDGFARQMNFPPLTDLTAADVGFTEPPGCAGLYAGAANVQQALARICDIGAEDVGVTLPNPLPPNTVASLLAARLGAAWPDLDGQPKSPSVQDMLQALLLEAAADALPYTVPGCGDATAPTVRSLLGLAPGPSQVATVLQALLCNLSGAQLPLDPASLTCPELIGSGETTVQGGLDFLCRTRLTSCAVAVPVGMLETLLRDFAAGAGTDLWLCLLPGQHDIAAALSVSGKRSLRISAAAAGATTVRLVTGILTLEAQEIGLEGIRLTASSSARTVLRGGRIVANRCIFNRSSSSESLPPMVRLEPLAGVSELIWRDNVMSDTWSRTVGGDAGGVFQPGVVNNAGVLAAVDNIRANPDLFENPVLYRSLADELAGAIAAMGGSERLAWRNGVNNLPLLASRAPAGALSRAPLLTSAVLGADQPMLANANFGNRTVLESRNDFSSAIDSINAVGGSTAEIGPQVDSLILLLFEFGYGVALALSSIHLEGNLTDNHVDGELLLMNNLESGLDPRNVTIASRSGNAITTPVIGSGHLSLTGNRIQRLWARLPDGSVSDNTLTQTVSGYASVALSGNQLFEYGHSLVAEVLTMTGNRLVGGSATGSHSIGQLVANRPALTGNVESTGNNAAVITLVAPLASFPGNLVTINRV